ncbi:unnamed protein product [Durusdinium trenchii]|uniref:Uncharacterized protein n=1 Tax=Durusdinium trenchii TaxID=1381693 RepID=A0ABP0S4J1_9DINO
MIEKKKKNRKKNNNTENTKQNTPSMSFYIKENRDHRPPDPSFLGSGTEVPTSPAPLTPMVCPRCLHGDLPNFPYVSVGELMRSYGTDQEVFRPPEDVQESSTCDSAEGEFSPEDPQASQELGEDIILSWATGVLTDGIVLCKDERGDYFRWLARIVLYDMLDEEVLQERAKSREDTSSTKVRSREGGKRMSFVMALSAATPPLESDKPEKAEKARPSVSEATTRSRGSRMEATNASMSLASLISNFTADRSQAVSKKKADEAQQLKEAERDWSIPIPDLFLARMRVRRRGRLMT